MKQKTEDNLITGGLLLGGGIAAIMLMSRSEEATGGFGGGGGIPLLTGDTDDAAEPDSIINYILPTIPEVPPMWDMETPIVSKKATYAPSLIPTYPLEYYTSGGVSELSSFASKPQKLKSVMELQHYADPFAYAFSGRKESAPDVSSVVKKSAEPTQFKDASVGGFFDFLYPLTQLGKGARGRDIALKEKDVKSAVMATKKIEAQRVSTAREYSKVAVGGREWTGGLTSTTKGAGVHFTTSGTGTLKKRPKKSTAGQPD